MQKYYLVLYLICTCIFGGFTQTIKTVEGRYTYYAPASMSMQQAEQEALKRAQINALADAFGRIVTENTTSISTTNDELFYQEGNSLVKGEWIETIGTPKYERSIFEDGFCVTCTIKGKAREISNSKSDLKVSILCNHPEAEYEHLDFKDNDKIYVKFKSAEHGYVSIYLYDKKNDIVSCLLPYPRDSHGIIEVKQDKEYIFFSKKHNELSTRAFEYVMNCSDALEVNTVYILFSKKSYSKPSLEDMGEGTLKHLNYERFQRWFTRCQSTDETFQIVSKNINIRKH